MVVVTVSNIPSIPVMVGDRTGTTTMGRYRTSNVMLYYLYGVYFPYQTFPILKIVKRGQSCFSDVENMER